jgi:hypothetical protein
MAMTVADIIDLLGGPKAVGKAMRIPPTTVGNWKVRQSIPSRHYAALLRLGCGRITAEQLVQAHGK